MATEKLGTHLCLLYVHYNRYASIFIATNYLVHQLQLAIKLKGEDEIIKCIRECSSDSGRLLATQVLFTDNQVTIT